MREPDWIEIFKEFHKDPELGFAEVNTTARIRRILDMTGVPYEDKGINAGIAATVKGNGTSGRRVGLRADIDALPIKEESGLEWSSKNPGVMHACGHDFHIVTALAAAYYLSENADALAGDIIILFQPGEEAFDGARNLIAAGLADGLDEIYALHVDPALDAGHISILNGPVAAAVDRFEYIVKGAGTHAATPEYGRNPIPILTDFISELTDVYEKVRKDGKHKSTVTFTRLYAGETWNVIPEEALTEGTVRTLDEGQRFFIRDEFAKRVSLIEKRENIQIITKWQSGSPVVENDPALARRALEVLHNISGYGVIYKEALDKKAEMTGDDFSYYTKEGSVPKSLYIRYGTGKGPSLHDPRFTADPYLIGNAARFITGILADAVNKKGKNDVS